MVAIGRKEEDVERARTHPCHFHSCSCSLTFPRWSPSSPSSASSRTRHTNCLVSKKLYSWRMDGCWRRTWMATCREASGDAGVFERACVCVCWSARGVCLCVCVCVCVCMCVCVCVCVKNTNNVQYTSMMNTAKPDADTAQPVPFRPPLAIETTIKECRQQQCSACARLCTTVGHTWPVCQRTCRAP
jgi:hypothetical protein